MTPTHKALTPEQIELAKGLKIEEIVKQNKT